MKDLEKSEQAFYEEILATMRRTGEIGDVFPRMVAYNVPAYVLGVFWPEERTRLIASNEFPAFCIAEKDWRGRIENLHSTVKDEAGNPILTFEKSYVMQCDTMYVVANAGAGLALCRIPRSPGQVWTSRAEASVVFNASDGSSSRDHFIVQGKESLSPGQFIALTKRQYTVAGITIPRREITGVAMLSIALLEHHGVSVAPVRSKCDDILARRTGGLDKESVILATEVFRFFQEHSRGIQLHPFWERAAGMFRIPN
ncbi:MAG: hypothetical protein K8S54_14885 [Spirochaetia bacterium]|nr:hypothetical protein [Spirochaetia bacterium]